MSHIKSISLNNFRVFDKESEFELCPLTLLTGPNSSGKSSILKALLLLKSNVSSNLQVLDFSGPKHILGTFQGTRNKSSEDSDFMTFGFRISLGNPEYRYSSFVKEPVTTKRSVYYVLRETEVKSTEDIVILLSYRQNDRSGKIAEIRLYIKDDKVPFLHLSIGENTDQLHKLKLDYNRIIKKKIIKNILFDPIEDRYIKKVKKPEVNKIYSLPVEFSMKENMQKRFFDEPYLVFGKLYEKFIRDNGPVINEDFHPYILNMPLRRILSDLSSIIENTEYLEAVRANSKRIYTNDSQGTSFNELILDYRSRDVSEKSREFINKWLRKFDIADELRFENIEGVATSLYLIKDGVKTALADLGYGITQFIPILLKVSLEMPIDSNRVGFNYVKKLILLEEPETNLHPMFQSLMADFLLDATRTFEVRFLIETHSEYLVRKFQLLTAEGLLQTNESVLYYFTANQDGYDEKVRKIRIGHNGSLDGEFGVGFFDEATKLKLELLKRKAIVKEL